MADLQHFLNTATAQEIGMLQTHEVRISDVTFELLFKRSETPRLFVFLSAGARKKGDTTTRFNRQKWAPHIDGTCLYLEDPCIKFYSGIRTGWFYGTQSVSFARLAHEIADGVRTRLGIAIEDVTFVGSSSGGHAALYMADHMQGAAAICDNPQIYMRHSNSLPQLEEAAGLRIADPDPFERAGLGRILKNKRSRFYIEVNRNSQHDYDLQLQSLIAESGQALSEGINLVNDSIIVVHPFDFSNPHNTFSSMSEFNALWPVLERHHRGEPGLEAALAAHLAAKQGRLSSEDMTPLAQMISTVQKGLDAGQLSIQPHKAVGLRVLDLGGRFEYVYAPSQLGEGGDLTLYAYKRSFGKALLETLETEMISSRVETPNTYMFRSHPISPEDLPGGIMRFINQTSPHMQAQASHG